MEIYDRVAKVSKYNYIVVFDIPYSNSTHTGWLSAREAMSLISPVQSYQNLSTEFRSLR